MDLAVRITDYLRGQPVPDLWSTTEFAPYTLFKNYQPGRNRGLRLTHFGWEMMRGHFRYWSYQMPPGWTPKPGHLVGLQDHLDWPYYFGNGYLRIFGEQDAMEIRLVNDDVILWLDGLSRKGQGKI
jgi:hypothetical protein